MTPEKIRKKEYNGAKAAFEQPRVVDLEKNVSVIVPKFWMCNK
jgi:hypothetical protein